MASLSLADRPLLVGQRVVPRLGEAQPRLRQQRPADGSSLGDVAQTVDRGSLGHCRRSRTSSGSDPASSGGAPMLSSVHDARTLCASAFSRATASSSSAERGREAFKNFIDGALPLRTHRHASYVRYPTIIDETEILRGASADQTGQSFTNSASTIRRRTAITRALIRPIR